MRFLEELRDPKPRLKPGFTYFRLSVFVVVALGLLVAAEHFATGKAPSQDECIEKGIDPILLKEGTCKSGGSTLVVVDRHSTLKLDSLEAKLLGVHERRPGVDSNRRASSPDRLLTFRLAITNLTDDPATLGRGQVVLNAWKPRVEDAATRDHSLLEQVRRIPPGATVGETATFRVPVATARGIHKGGNLDILNFGSSVSPSEPDAIFSQSEYGVIRTYH